MDDTHLQQTAVAVDGGELLMTPVGSRRSTIRPTRRHAPTTLMASLGILLAMTVGIVSTTTTNWSRAQSTPTARSSLAEQATAADQSADNGPVDRARATASRSTARVREGTHLAHRLGQFTQIGDRLSFTPEGSSVQWVVLENLVLDRVSHVLADTSDTLNWSVSGRVTEFRGANFVILERAVVKRRTPSGQESDVPQTGELQSDGISDS